MALKQVLTLTKCFHLMLIRYNTNITFFILKGLFFRINLLLFVSGDSLLLFCQYFFSHRFSLSFVIHLF